MVIWGFVIMQFICILGDIVYAHSYKKYENDDFFKTEEVAYNNSKEKTLDNNVYQSDCNDDNKNGVKVLIESKKYKLNEAIKIYIENDNKKTGHYEIGSEGTAILNSEEEFFEFQVNSQEYEFGNIDIYAECLDGEIEKQTIYTYTSDDAIYISDISDDTAWYECMYEG